MYEGRSTCWLFENILTHKHSRLYCIDPFESFDGLPAQRERFKENTLNYSNRIFMRETKSHSALRQISPPISFVIVDGAHDAPSVLEDAVLAWRLLINGGVMICDDYAWTGQGHENCAEQDKPRMALDAFVEIYQPEILHKEYQLILRKP